METKKLAKTLEEHAYDYAEKNDENWVKDELAREAIDRDITEGYFKESSQKRNCYVCTELGARELGLTAGDESYYEGYLNDVDDAHVQEMLEAKADDYIEDGTIFEKNGKAYCFDNDTGCHWVEKTVKELGKIKNKDENPYLEVKTPKLH